MRVFAKKAFEFTQYEQKDGMQVVAEKATTSPLSFCNLPDWVTQDPLFGWARIDGDIEIIQTAADQKSAELNAKSKNKGGNKESSKSLMGSNTSKDGSPEPDANTDNSGSAEPNNA